MRRNFIYTQTRLQARHGMRPDERTWGLVESQKDLANYLQSARQSRIGPWLTGMQATDNHHFIESTLLKHYRDYVEEVAAWVPSEWRKSVQWVICLTYLPVIQHLITAFHLYFQTAQHGDGIGGIGDDELIQALEIGEMIVF